MADDFDTTSLQITLKHEKHSASDVALLTQSVDGIVCASVWATIAEVRESESDAIDSARRILSRALENDKARARFFPEFGGDFAVTLSGRRNRRPPNRVRSVADMPNFDPFDPLDVGVAFGLTAWFRKVLQQGDAEVYTRLFSFANIARLEHKSPLVLGLLLAIGTGVLTPVLLTYGIMRAVGRCKRLDLENQLRETEVELRHEELRQRRIQTEILETLKNAVNERAASNNLSIPDEALAAAATISSPAVAELSTSPIIGSITLGLSSKIGS